MHLRIRIWGLEKTLSIARDPFDRKVITKDFVSLDQADWNGQ